MKECCSKYMLAQFGGDQDVVNEIYAEYKSSAKDKIADAHAALESGDWVRLDRIAHTIKGNALAAGDDEMAECALTLRKSAALSDKEGSAALITRLSELWNLL